MSAYVCPLNSYMSQSTYLSFEASSFLLLCLCSGRLEKVSLNIYLNVTWPMSIIDLSIFEMIFITNFVYFYFFFFSSFFLYSVCYVFCSIDECSWFIRKCYVWMGRVERTTHMCVGVMFMWMKWNTTKCFSILFPFNYTQFKGIYNIK